MNGKSFPVNPVWRSADGALKCTAFTFSKSSKFDVSSFELMVGTNGGVAGKTKDM